MSSNPASAEAAEVERVLADLAQLRLDPHRVSLRYRAGLLCVAVAMVLLPLAYFTLVGALAFWLGGQLRHPPGLDHPWASIIYVLLAVGGPVAILFMIKPWFAPHPEEEQAVPLHRGEAPNLECFVGLLARAVGAPGPTRIEFDCSANAGAGFRGGWRGVVDEDFKLTIGLPLVAGLSLRSFIGVLAHELGHFSQRNGMRIAWLIVRFNERFSRLVDARDRWDQMLSVAAHSERAHVQLFGRVTLALVWLCRQPLRLLRWIAAGISSFALRQLEFDADGFEVVLAGSKTFRKTSRSINLLNVGSIRALELVGETLPEGHLPRNLPLLARRQTEGLSERVRAAVEADMMEVRSARGLFRGAKPGSLSRFFSSHPCDRERIDRAERYDAPGLIHSSLPASHLFDDFEATAERVTGEFYGAGFDLDISGCELTDNDLFCGTVSDRESYFAACEKFFDGRFTVTRPLAFQGEDWQLIADFAQVPEGDFTLQRARQMNRFLAENGTVFDDFEAAEEEVVQCSQAIELFQAGFRLRTGFAFSSRYTALSDQQAVASERRDRALVRLASFERITCQRLAHGVAWSLRSGDDAGLVEETRRVLAALTKLSDALPHLRRLRRKVLAQRAVLQNLNSAGLSRMVIDRLRQNSTELERLSACCLAAVAGVKYPFTHAAGPISVSEYASARFNASRGVARTFKESEASVERLLDLYFRCVGFLCECTKEAENSFINTES